jgi:hypothetical protein
VSVEHSATFASVVHVHACTNHCQLSTRQVGKQVSFAGKQVSLLLLTRLILLCHVM